LGRKAERKDAESKRGKGKVGAAGRRKERTKGRTIGDEWGRGGIRRGWKRWRRVAGGKGQESAQHKGEWEEGESETEWRRGESGRVGVKA